MMTLLDYEFMSRTVDSTPLRGDPLLHSYSDYEDSVYGNSYNLVILIYVLPSGSNWFGGFKF